MKRKLLVATVAVAFIGTAAGAAWVGLQPPVDDGSPTNATADGPAGIAYFESEEAFVEYVTGEQGVAYAAGAGGASGGAATARTTDAGAQSGGDGAARARPTTTEAAAGGPRVGTTNVQVAGVDEPDLVKTDGEHFFYAPAGRHLPVRVERVRANDEAVTSTVARPERRPPTTVIDIGEPADPEVAARINESGRLLQHGDSLVVLAADELVGYDVSDASDPERVWSHPLNGSLVTARLTDGQLYVVTASPVDPEDPCPVEPLGGAAPVACTEIAHPEEPVRVDATYTTAALDPATGEVLDSASVVGTRGRTVVYATGENLYLTYTRRTDRTELLTDFLVTSETVPESVRADIREIRASGRTDREKLRASIERVELWMATAERDREAIGRELTTELESYLEERKRNLTRTGIVRISLGERVSVAAHGTVPGRPLNQFALDSHEGSLRIATTVPAYGSGESVNDLYTLDAGTLERRGAVTGMSEGQRVYAVRYVGETAYVVTFRQVDPLHVLDLSDPDDPEQVGKLELPGFSTYLHPIDDGHVLGIGEEDGRVKAVLFDVSDPTDPTIDDTLRLEAGWSAIAESHHAFTIDRRHGVFVLPAGDETLAVGYTGGDLDVRDRVVTEEPATRARYVGNYLYVFAGDTIAVVDERAWETETRLTLDG